MDWMKTPFWAIWESIPTVLGVDLMCEIKHEFSWTFTSSWRGVHFEILITLSIYRTVASFWPVASRNHQIIQLPHEPVLYMLFMKPRLHNSRTTCCLMDMLMDRTAFVFCSNEVFCTHVEKGCTVWVTQWAGWVQFSGLGKAVTEPNLQFHVSLDMMLIKFSSKWPVLWLEPP